MNTAAVLVAIWTVITAAAAAGAEVHRVGGSTGWTTINITADFYRDWVASQRFNVGDTLLFQYNSNFHNVVRVTHRNYNACNATTPYATWTSGNDSFLIPRPGHFYFICGFTHHCEAGQKLDVRIVPNRRGKGAPAPAIHAPSPAPAPAQKNGAGSSSLRNVLAVIAAILTHLYIRA